MRQCRSRGCDRLRIGWSNFCDSHKKTDRRHGHPEQRAVLASELKPFTKEIATWIDIQANSEEIWDGLEQTWAACVAEAQAQVTRWQTGKSVGSCHLKACEDIVNVSKDNAPQTTILAVLGMAALMEIRPYLFRSDRARFFQVARRFRGLTEKSAGKYWNDREQRWHRVYRDPPPRSAEWLGKHLMASLGGLGIRIWHCVQKDRQRLAEAKKAAYGALEAAQLHAPAT